MKLYIDTRDNSKTVVGLGEARLERESGREKSQQVLPLLEQLLEKQKRKLDQVTEIEVETGPGSFTGLKVGVAVANALGWVLGVPVNGQKIVEPTY